MKGVKNIMDKKIILNKEEIIDKIKSYGINEEWLNTHWNYIENIYNRFNVPMRIMEKAKSTILMFPFKFNNFEKKIGVKIIFLLDLIIELYRKKFGIDKKRRDFIIQMFIIDRFLFEIIIYEKGE